MYLVVIRAICIKCICSHFNFLNVPEAIQEAPKPKEELESVEDNLSSRIESLTIHEDVKEGDIEDDEGLPTYPYERLIIGAEDPAGEIDVTKREVNIVFYGHL